MNTKTYQEEVKRTSPKDPGTFLPHEIMMVWHAMGLAGEAGEVADIIKKAVLHRHGLESLKAKIRKEIGDVLWYLASLCNVLGFDMEEIMVENIEKLRIRYPHGFDTEDSKRRVDVKDGS